MQAISCLLWDVFLLQVALQGVLAAPSPSTVGSDLRFLYQNDLNWPTATSHNGTILINNPGTNARSLAACKVLNEDLLPIIGANIHSDINSLIEYLIFNKEFSLGQQFWVASSSTKSNSCAAFSAVFGVQCVPCNTYLPAFCSQSAPYRRNMETDTSAQWQVQVISKAITVIGTRDHLSFRFIGIPYADSFQRFSYSKKFTGQGTLNALTYGSPCLQPLFGSEDCLFLNIYTPYLPQNSSKAKTLRPVLFWIHGGGFIVGKASDGIFDGGNMVSRGDVVVVSINYRLGTLGFLALQDGVTNGNFGIADQITALQWVQEHIADFGGDPSRVTIYGQSAGASSIRALLGARPAFGLFIGAIAQSNLGGFGYASTYSEYLSIEQQYSSFGAPTVAAVGCGNSTDILSCLRSVSATALIAAPNAPRDVFLPRYIVVDGKIVTNDHLEVNGASPTADAHVIFGWMRDDGADTVGSFPTSTSTLQQQLLNVGVSSDVTSQVLANPALFPMPSGSNATLNLFNLTSRIGTDGQFLCIDQATVIAAAANKVFPSVYAYQFDRSYAGYEPIPGLCEPPATAAFPHGDPSQPYFRCHSGELYYVLGTMGQDLKPFRDSNDLLMAQVSVDIWTSFARTFEPNPSLAYLLARGYTSTISALQKTGPWNPISASNPNPLRHIDIPFSNSDWREQAQCNLLGYPSTLFDS